MLSPLPAPFGGMQSSFSSRRGSAILAAVLLRLRLPRLLPISYFHHEESPELEQGHGEAQHGASRPCHQQEPNADILYPRQVIARLSPYPPIGAWWIGIRANIIFFLPDVHEWHDGEVKRTQAGSRVPVA